MPAPSPVLRSSATAPRWAWLRQRLQPHLQDPVAAPPLDVRHEADAAGVVLKTWVVQTLFGWQRPVAVVNAVLVLG